MTEGEREIRRPRYEREGREREGEADGTQRVSRAERERLIFKHSRHNMAAAAGGGPRRGGFVVTNSRTPQTLPLCLSL